MLLSHSLKQSRSKKEWVALLDELAEISVKCRDQFRCRVSGCGRRWEPTILPSGKVRVAPDCHWAHIIPRARGLAVRHEIANGLTLCAKHHQEFDALSHEEELEYVRRCGVTPEQYLELEARSRILVTNSDWKEQAERLIEYFSRVAASCRWLVAYEDTVVSYFSEQVF